MIISFFGASVTVQKNGFPACIKNINKNNTVYIYGYGGMHIKDAGICFIDTVLQNNPNYVFIDWFSTGYIEINENTKEYIDTIIYKFNEKKCKLIFLFLPNENHNNRIEFYFFCKEYLKKYDIFYIDLNESIKFSNEICKDSVHTNENGSSIYAKIIYKKFINNVNKISYAKSQIIKTKYYDIKCINIEKTFDKIIKICGNCFIIGFLSIIGPHSGIIKAKEKENENETIFNTWDIYCHYERDQFIINNLNINGKIIITILQENFDTSKCRREFDFTKHIKKLKIKKIYYVGNFISFDDK